MERLLSSPVGAADQLDQRWRLALLPRQTKPITQFEVASLDGERVLRVKAQKSYGKIMHPVQPRHERARKLKWQWRVDQAPQADLRRRQGDDVALRVCAFFDWPMQRVPAVDRARLSMAELLAGEPLPTATICYVWDASLPTDTVMPNAFTRRIRMIVVNGEGSPMADWMRHERDLHKDFRTAFADEWQEGDAVPPLRAVLIGADTDNTGSESLSYLRTIDLAH
jgi:hypothetical protein